MNKNETAGKLGATNTALWKEANELVEFMYGLLPDMPEDEKWYTASKIKSAATDLLYSVSLSVAGGLESGNSYNWDNAHKSAFALQTLYRFSGRQHFVAIDPQIMVRFEKLVSQLDSEYNTVKVEIDQKNEQELNAWREKHTIWKEIPE